MKLSLENHPELLQLAYYFKKIELLAEKMGMDVDDLVTDKSKGKSSLYMSFKKNVLAIAQKRADLLHKRDRDGSQEEPSIVGLTILFNKDKTDS